MSNNKQIRFENFPDLQSRLVLVPYHDTHGTGAAVASYTPKVVNVTGYVLTNIQGLHHSDQSDWLLHMDFQEILSLLRDAPTPIVLTFTDMPEHPGIDGNATTPMIVTPSSEESEDDTDDVKEQVDYHQERHPPTAVKNATITNSTEKMNPIGSGNKNALTSPITAASTSSSSTVTKSNKESADDSKLKNRFIKWGTMVGKATNKLANATNAAVYATADVVHDAIGGSGSTPIKKAPKPSSSSSSVPVTKNATSSTKDLFSPISTTAHPPPPPPPVTSKPMDSSSVASSVASVTIQSSYPYPSLALEERPTSPQNDSSRPLYGIFLQTTKDGYIPLDGISRTSITVTNSSLLTVRFNANQSQSTRDLKFQWLRSTYPLDDPRYQETSWITLHGANRAMYQPSVTDCGYQLKCVTTDDTNEDEDPSVHECILQRTVEIDPIILNTAQKNLEGGGNVSFESLLGCGKAEGKILRITIEKGPSTDGQTTSHLFIYQVSGNRDALLHDVNTPIRHATAEADASKPNIFYLIIPENVSDSTTSTIQYLCTHNRLELYAEDRVTRESFLTTLGIANYIGTASTISTLFPAPKEPVVSGMNTLMPTNTEIMTTDAVVVETNSTPVVDLHVSVYPDDGNGDISKSILDDANVLEKAEPIFTEETRSTSDELLITSGNAETESISKSVRNDANVLEKAEPIFTEETRSTSDKLLITSGNAETESMVPEQTTSSSDERLITSMNIETDPLEPETPQECNLLGKDEWYGPVEKDEAQIMPPSESYDLLGQGDSVQPSYSMSTEMATDFLVDMSDTLDNEKEVSMEHHDLTYNPVDESKVESLAVETTLATSTTEETSHILDQASVSLTSTIEMDLLRNQLDDANQLIAELQRRLNDSEQIMKLKDDELLIVKKEAAEENRKFYEAKEALQASENRISTMDEDTMKMRKDLLSRISSLEKELKDKQESTLENEKMFRSWNNEKAVLTAAIEARDGKLIRFEELQSEVAELEKVIEERDSLRFELSTAKYQLSEAANCLMETQQLLSQSQSSYDHVKIQMEELQAKFDDVNSRCLTLEADNNSTQEKYQAIKVERNTLKQKNESLAKDMARIRKTGMEISDIERIIQENSDLHAQVELLKAQQPEIVGNLDHDENAQSTDAGENSNDDNDAISGPTAEELRRAWEQKAELERMVKELTEYVNAKQSQLDTMKDINKQLTEELQNVARSRRAPLKPFFDKDTKAGADTDNKGIKAISNSNEALSKVVEERDSLKIELESMKAQAVKYQSDLNDAETRVLQYQSACNELQQEVDSLTKQLQEGSVKSLSNEKAIDDLQSKYDLLVQTQGNLTESQAICLKLQQQAYDLTQQLREEKSRLAASEKDMEKLRYQYMALENERNNLNNKLHSQTKDLSRIVRDGMTVEDLERTINDYTAISAELATVKAQRKTLSEEVTSLTQKLAVSAASAGPASKTPAGDALRNALLQKFELERVVKELTEYVNAKEMQIETLKTINRAMTQELQTLRKH